MLVGGVFQNQEIFYCHFRTTDHKIVQNLLDPTVQLPKIFFYYRKKFLFKTKYG